MTVKPTALDSQIEAVAVFREGALVTRVAELDRANGHFPSEVLLTGLPLTADDGSFRVKLEGLVESGGMAPLAEGLRVALDVPPRAGEAVDEPQRELDAATLQVSQLRVTIAQVEAEIRRLGRPELPGRPKRKRGEPPGEPPHTARLRLLEFHAERTQALTDELVVLREELRRADDAKKEAQDRLLRASSDRPIEPHMLRKALHVRLGQPDGEPAERVRLVATYQVPGARWAPCYSLRLSGSGDAELQMRAFVAQRSGENWEGAQLTLSTAERLRWADLPELPSLRIGRRRSMPARTGWRPPPSGFEELYADWDRSFARQLAEHPERRKSAPPGLVAAYEDEGATVMFGASDMDVVPTAAAELEDLLEDAPGAALSAPPDGAELEGAVMFDLGAPEPAEGSAAPVPPQAMAAAAAPMIGRSGRMQRRRKGPKSKGVAPATATSAAPPAAVTAREDLLNYGALRMPPARAGRAGERGQLSLRTDVQLYLELLVDVELGIDLAKTIDKAVSRARSAGERLPSRCRLASSDDGFAYAYVAETRIDVPSDKNYHAVPLLARATPTALTYVCVPREATDVFRIARFENPLPGPILPGPVDVYLDDQFLVTGRLPSTPSSASVELGLGVEQSVKVSRNTRFHEAPTTLRTSRTLEHEIAIEVRNNLPRSVSVEVRERIPAAGPDDPNVKVSVGKVEPAWERYEPPVEPKLPVLQGGHRWRVQIESAAKQGLNASYTIKIPSKYELVGGNRREG